MVIDEHRSWAKRGLGAALFCLTLAAGAQADSILDETNVVAAAGAAPTSEFSFTATTAQALTVTLTDQQIPASFQSLQIAVTLGNQLVGTAAVDASTGKTSATLTLPAATGTYELHVVGTPAKSGFGSYGSFGVCTAPQATPTACIAADSFSDTIQTPSTAATTGQSTLDTTFTTSATAGTYTVKVTDDAFPVALQNLGGGISLGSTPVTALSLGTTPVTLAGTTTYELLIAANADASVQAGLYSIQILDPTGAVVFARTLPVGELPSSTIVDNSTAQSLSLSVTDQAYPFALGGLGAAVTSGATVLASLSTTGKTQFNAPMGNLEIWQYAVAGIEPGVYSLSLAGGAATLYSTTQVVNPSNAATTTNFAFAVPISSAGDYTLSVNDLQFPAALNSLTYSIAENGKILTLGSTGGFTAPAAGTAIVVVDAIPAQGSGGSQGNLGIFGVTVSTAGSTPTVVFDQTQAVGGVFNSRALNLGTAGTFNVTLTDLGFPTAFSELAAVVSQNGAIVGKIFGAGTFPFKATPGNYIVTFVANPGAQSYGLYSLDISSASPTVTLTSSATSVPAGQSVQLSWTTANATSCSASGNNSNWSGNEPISSTGVGVAISTDSTLTLTCTGPGGSTSQSVSVTAAAVSSSSHGGGALDPAWLLLLSIGLGVRLGRRTRNPS